MVKRLTLKNGTRVILEKMPMLDTVSIGFLFLTGSANEKKEENGYTHFIEHMLFRGTDKISSKELIFLCINNYIFFILPFKIKFL